MNEQPRVQNAVQTRLARELALFVADAFQILQRVVQFGWQPETQFLENPRCLRRIGKRRMTGRGSFDKRSHAAEIKLAQMVASIFAYFDADFYSRRGCVAAGRCINVRRTVERTARGRGELICFLPKLRANVIDLLVNRFHGDFDRNPAGNIDLERRAKNTARNDNEEQNHQHQSERAARMEARVTENDRKANQAEPEMAAHPRLCASHTPHREFLPCTEKSRENHQREASDTEGKADGAPSARALRGIDRIGYVYGGGDYQENRRANHPIALCAVE